jgi:hypothetical protein
MRLRSALFATVAALALAALQVPADPAAGDLSPVGLVLLSILPAVTGYVSTLLYGGIKTIIPVYDRLPSIVHQVAAPFFGLALGYVATFANVHPVADLTGIDQPWLDAVANAVAMAGVFRFFKRKDPTDATLALQVSRESNPVPTSDYRGT